MPTQENWQNDPLITHLREKYGEIISIPALLTLYALESDIQMSESSVGTPFIDITKYPLAELKLLIEYYQILDDAQQWGIVRKLEELDPYKIFASFSPEPIQPTSLSEEVF